MNTGVSKSKPVEPTIKHLMKETRLYRWVARNLVSKGKYIRAKIFIKEKFTLK